MTVALAVVVASCGGSDSDSASKGGKSVKKPAKKTPVANADGSCTKVNESPQQWDSEPKMTIAKSATYTARLKTSEGMIVAKLDAALAPHAVNNFVFLAKNGFYTCIPFHRIMRDFMVQTGDPTGTGTSGPGYNITDDKVTKPYDRGVLAMANTGAANTGGSQFFIVHGTTVNQQLTPTYSLFGKVTSGLDVLDRIATAPVVTGASGENSSPEKPVWLEKVTVTEG